MRRRTDAANPVIAASRDDRIGATVARTLHIPSSVVIRLLIRAVRKGIRSVEAIAYSRRAEQAVAHSLIEDPPVGPNQRFRGASDRYWLWLNQIGPTQVPGLGRLLPPLPSEELQLRYTGSAGQTTLREAADAFLLFRSLYASHSGPLRPTTDILDFGCGWGRIIRYFNRDVSPEHLHGADINESVLSYCRDTNRWSQFHRVEVLPPSDFSDQSFDLIYAYSVFSHLSKPAHDAWLAEFSRILRPGGLLIATTWPRAFIERCEWLRTSPDAVSLPESHRISGGAFTDVDESLRAYDEGDFCFSYRNEDDPEHFGEACLSERFVRADWPDSFDIVDFIDDRSKAPQNVIVARRR